VWCFFFVGFVVGVVGCWGFFFVFWGFFGGVVGLVLGVVWFVFLVKRMIAKVKKRGRMLRWENRGHTNT